MKYDTKGNLTDSFTGQAATSNSNTSCSGGTSGRHNHVDYNADGTPKDAYGPVTSALASLTPADETQYTYYSAEPNAGELQQVLRPGGNSSCTTDRTGCTSYTYDGLSRVTQVTDGNGNTTSYSYDQDDRVTAVMTAGTSTCTSSDITAGTCTRYSYDGEGNLTSRADTTGTTTFTYDRLNRSATQTQPGGTVLATSYDAAGNLTQYSQQLRGQSTDTVSYAYDGANQLTSVTDATGTFTVTSNNDGRPTSLALPYSVGVGLNYGYTAHSGKLNSLTTSGGSGLPSYSYDYNTGSTETGKLHKSTRNGTNTYYGYDSDDRLCWTGTAAFSSCGSATNRSYGYTYDANANLRSAPTSTGSTYYGYNENNQLCWSGPNDSTTAAMSQTCASTPSGDTTWTSDAQGNSTGTATGPIHYNNHNQADQITSTNGAGPVNQTYTDQGNNLRVTAGSDTFTTGGPLGVTARTTSGNTTYYTRDPHGQLLDEHGAAGTYYYMTDRQQSVVALIDTTGAAAATYTYTPYGAATVTNGSSTTAGQDNPWRYTGGYQDPTDGYYHLGARYYDTQSHFTQADPVAGSLNRPEKYNSYTYTAGDPTNNTDPTGRDGGSVDGPSIVGGLYGLFVCARFGTSPAGVACGVGVVLFGGVGGGFDYAAKEYGEASVSEPGYLTATSGGY